MDLKVIEGDLFDSTEQYLCHQCNVISQRAAHLAQSVFNRFPYSNIYAERDGSGPKPGQELGDIIIRGNGKNERLIINMLAQFYPGKTKYPNSPKDGIATRKSAFQMCLNKITDIPALQSIAFPFGIGCGAAGGDWLVYRKMIKNFAEEVEIPVRIYRLPD